MQQERNVTLDLYKIFLSVFVICIHFPPLFGKGDMLSVYFGNMGLPMIAVPSFFIINGFFLARIIDNQKQIRNYVIHLAIMHLLWSFIYLPSYYGMATIKNILGFFVAGYYHLWYLPALMLGAIYLFIANKLTQNKITIVLVAMLLHLTLTIIDNKSQSKLLETSLYIFSNSFIAFFYLAIGAYIRKLNIKNILFKHLIIIAITIGVIYSILILNQYFNIYLLKIFRLIVVQPILCSTLFLIILQTAIYRENKGYVKYLSNLSAGIYFVHLYLAIKYYPFFQTENNIVQLPLFLLMTIALVIPIIFINKKVKHLL